MIEKLITTAERSQGAAPVGYLEVDYGNFPCPTVTPQNLNLIVEKLNEIITILNMNHRFGKLLRP